MSFNGTYKISFSKVPGKVMENEFTINEDGKGRFDGFLRNITGDNPIQGTISERGEFDFEFGGGHRHTEQEKHPPIGGPSHIGPGGAGEPHGTGRPGGPGGAPVIMHFSGVIHDDGKLAGTLKVMEDETAITGEKIG